MVKEAHTNKNTYTNDRDETVITSRRTFHISNKISRALELHVSSSL